MGRDVFSLAARRRHHGFHRCILGQGAELAAGEVDGEMPRIILSLDADRAADPGARRDCLRQRRCEGHSRAPIQAIAEQQLLTGFGLVQRVPENHDVVEGFVDRWYFDQLHGTLAPPAIRPEPRLHP